MLGIVWAVWKCKIYLQGLPEFTIINDHKPLLSIINKQTLDEVENPRLQRLKEKLLGFNCKMEWKQGKTHIIPDCLSRTPVTTPKDDDLLAEVDGPLVHNIQLELQDPILKDIAEIGKADNEYQDSNQWCSFVHSAGLTETCHSPASRAPVSRTHASRWLIQKHNPSNGEIEAVSLRHLQWDREPGFWTGSLCLTHKILMSGMRSHLVPDPTEAYAIVESLRKWRHFLSGRHFKLITDQQSVSFIFNPNYSSKIKNEKILRWRLELSEYRYDILYRPGKNNKVADALSRVCANSFADHKRLETLHAQLCHPGITRFYHYVRSKHLPYSIDEVRKITNNCRVCCEIKP
ncbi:unnamed protein product [Nesidiocoris tenuis]|uniref:Reverse transcriptase RNase H-like domain-containing protein n=1 Tax=Nesidiocoris tenuis TaxID=355587 RepID=A0A6H5HP25_9HEMI|nr:unnamed protein product [Nesidiocoris tenuis]